MRRIFIMGKQIIKIASLLKNNLVPWSYEDHILKKSSILRRKWSNNSFPCSIDRIVIKERRKKFCPIIELSHIPFKI